MQGKGKKNIYGAATLEWLEADAERLHDKLKSMAVDSAEGLSGNKGYNNGLEQWMVMGKSFVPSGKTAGSLPAGWYRFGRFGQNIVPAIMDTRSDDLLRLPLPEYNQVLADMGKFWASEAKYREHGFPYTRGILLYGRPGTGKSGLVRLVCNDLVSKRDGVVFNLGGPEDIHPFETVFSEFREIEPERPCVAVMEDVDNFVRYGGSSLSKLLNILDGGMKYDNVVFLATTNHPEALLESLINRPSRFDRRYEVGTLPGEAREVYVKAKFKTLPAQEVDKVVRATDGFTVDMIKEAVLSIYVLGYGFDDTIGEIKELFAFNGPVGGRKGRFDGEAADRAGGRPVSEPVMAGGGAGEADGSPPDEYIREGRAYDVGDELDRLA